MNSAFTVVFVLAAPFWALMILAPAWSVTKKIVGSPWIVAPAALLYLILALPQLGDLLPALTAPTLESIRDLLGTDAGATLGWAHFIAFDLFVGRWIYLDNAERGLHPLVMAPILLLTILMGPVGFLVYLAVRTLRKPRLG